MSLLLRLLRLYRPVWGWLALAAALGGLTVLAQVGLMAVAGWFLAAMALAGAAGTSLNYFTPSALIRAAAIARTGGRYGERMVGHEATFRLIARLRVWLYRRLEPLSPADLAGWDGADLAGRLRGDLDRLETVYLRLIGPLAVAVAVGGLGGAWLARFDPALALTVTGLLALAGLGGPLIVARRAGGEGRAQVRRLTELSVAVVEVAQGLPDLLAFGAEARGRARIEALSADLIAGQRRLGRLAALSQAAHLLWSHLALWGAVVLAVPLLGAGGLSGPDLAMIALLSLALFEAVAPLPMAFLGLGGVVESARRVFALADTVPSLPEPAPAPEPPVPPPPRCALRLSGVAYGWGGRNLVSGLDLDLAPGTRLAVVGPSGSGKSTLILVLAGLVPPLAGDIRLDGRPIGTLDGETRRRCFAVAPQGLGLFSGRVRDIMRLGDAGADDPAIWRALAVAGLAETVAAFPDGLDTWVGEAGLTLSGGEARRLAVARALLRPAPILILDEPGEGLEPEAEAAMLDRVIDGLGERSLLLITHRPAGLARMDRVMTLAGPGAASAASE